MAALHQPFPMFPGRRAQVWRHQPAYRRPAHFHAEPELNVVFRGTAKLTIGNRSFELSRGDVAYFEPGVHHELVSASTDLELFVVALRPDVHERARLEFRAPPQEPVFHAELPASLFQSLAALAQGADPVSVETQVVDHFRQLYRPTSSVSSPVRRAIFLILENATWAEGDLARALGITASELSRRMQRELGVRFVDLRTRRRLLRFVDSIQRGTPLTRAALDAGFGSYAQLHRAFVGAHGFAPSEYTSGGAAKLDALFATPDATQRVPTRLELHSAR